MHSSIKNETREITVGARSSNLSKVQVSEVQQELCIYYPEIKFVPVYVETYGDIDLKTSLKDLDKTDFFTREVDTMLLDERCRVAIHSAKDLPDPMPKGLKVIAVTIGIDPSDSLVFREGETLESLPPGAKIGTSSGRREEMVKALCSDVTFVDVRGTIEKRLEKLEAREVDALVVAEAALIRLGFTHLDRMSIPGDTVEGQGQLAVVAREDDHEMDVLFSVLDCRREVS